MHPRLHPGYPCGETCRFLSCVCNVAPGVDARSGVVVLRNNVAGKI